MCGQCGCDSASTDFGQALDRADSERETSAARKTISVQENVLAKNARWHQSETERCLATC